MKGMRFAVLASIAASAIGLAAPAHADVDTDFTSQLNRYGIYGQRDYNAWLAKITCQRLDRGVDTTRDQSAHFVSINLPRGSTEVQAYQFLGTAITMYCPEHASLFG